MTEPIKNKVDSSYVVSSRVGVDSLDKNPIDIKIFQPAQESDTQPPQAENNDAKIVKESFIKVFLRILTSLL